MDFRQKIDRILSIKKIRPYKLAEISKMGNTLEKAYQENREMTQTSTEKFLRNMGISSEWWQHQKGPEFLSQKVENITPVYNEAAVKGNQITEAKEMMRALFDLEKLSEYRFVPKTVLDGEYRIMPKSELDQRTKELEQKAKEYEDLRNARMDTINALQKVITVYENEIADLRSKLTVPQNAK